MKRLALPFALVLAAMLPSPAVASHQFGDNPGPTGDGIHSYHYVHTEGKWKDDVCGDGYVVEFYVNEGYGGWATRVCHGATSRYQNDYFGHGCEAPLMGFSLSDDWFPLMLACKGAGLNSSLIHDRVSSIKVLNGFPAGRCFFIYEHNHWQGTWKQFNKDSFYPDLDWTGLNFNDRLDSWKIDDCRAGYTVW